MIVPLTCQVDQVCRLEFTGMWKAAQVRCNASACECKEAKAVISSHTSLEQPTGRVQCGAIKTYLTSRFRVMVRQDFIGDVIWNQMKSCWFPRSSSSSESSGLPSNSEAQAEPAWGEGGLGEPGPSGGRLSDTASLKSDVLFTGITKINQKVSPSNFKKIIWASCFCRSHPNRQNVS